MLSDYKSVQSVMTAMALVQSVWLALTSVSEECPKIPEEEHPRGAHRLDQGDSRGVDTYMKRTQRKRIQCKFKKTTSIKINNNYNKYPLSI